jgi:hypothetical protein
VDVSAAESSENSNGIAEGVISPIIDDKELSAHPTTTHPESDIPILHDATISNSKDHRKLPSRVPGTRSLFDYDGLVRRVRVAWEQRLRTIVVEPFSSNTGSGSSGSSSSSAADGSEPTVAAVDAADHNGLGVDREQSSDSSTDAASPFSTDTLISGATDTLPTPQGIVSSQDLVTVFYTSLWHSLLLPRMTNDFDGEYLSFGADAVRTVKKTSTGNFNAYFDDFSMWDIFRAQVPLLNLLYTDIIRDVASSLISKADDGGWLPIFPAWNSYTGEMIGDHCTVLLADAFQKGVLGYKESDRVLLGKAVYYSLQNALKSPSDDEYNRGLGRRALKSYLKYGFIPLDDGILESPHPKQQVSRSLEYAFDDYVVAQFARLYVKQLNADAGSSSSGNSGSGSTIPHTAAHDNVAPLSSSTAVLEGRITAPQLDTTSLPLFEEVDTDNEKEVDEEKRQLLEAPSISDAEKAIAELLARSKNYHWVIDSDTGDAVNGGSGDASTGTGAGAGVGFIRGRFANLTWAEDTATFNPTLHYPWLTETNVWQYTWSVQHDVEGMIRTYGGPQKFTAKLNQFFDDGWYNHGNEPDHHALFLYAYVPGEAWNIQRRLPGIIKSQYGPTERGLPVSMHW